MQLLVQVICTRGKSLRDGIAKDRQLARDNLEVSEQKRPGRQRGWTKVHSSLPDRHGAINIEWDAKTHVLICRVVTRGKGKPNQIVGDFVDYLLRRHRRRIEAINIIPRS
jgi:hypothetical protein